MPSYYSPNLPYTCTTPGQQGNNLSQIVNKVVVYSLLSVAGARCELGVKFCLGVDDTN